MDLGFVVRSSVACVRGTIVDKEEAGRGIVVRIGFNKRRRCVGIIGKHRVDFGEEDDKKSGGAKCV